MHKSLSELGKAYPGTSGQAMHELHVNESIGTGALGVEAKQSIAVGIGS